MLPPSHPGKRSRIEFLEAYNLQLQALMKQRQRKESTAKDFQGKDAGRLQGAIQKEIRNNLETGAYRLLSTSESEAVLREKREKVMNSRYVLTKSPWSLRMLRLPPQRTPCFRMMAPDLTRPSAAT